jgi:hypothetical protein
MGILWLMGVFVFAVLIGKQQKSFSGQYLEILKCFEFTAQFGMLSGALSTHFPSRFLACFPGS